jgi:hypothetical protein
MLDSKMRQNYEVANYRVDTAQPFVLKIGVPSAELGLLYRQTKSDCAAFVTACNSMSQALTDGDNAVRQSELEKELARRSLKFVLGVGMDGNETWPNETSFLVFNLSLEASRALARKYEQNAFVWCGSDATPQLILSCDCGQLPTAK